MPITGQVEGTKTPMIWTDYLLIGGSSSLQTAGQVRVFDSSGTSNRGFVQGIAGGGSPASIQNMYLQVGSGNCGAGSASWTVFPEAFATAPFVVATSYTTMSGIRIHPGSITAGSFYTLSEPASQEFGYLAVGTR